MNKKNNFRLHPIDTEFGVVGGSIGMNLCGLPCAIIGTTAGIGCAEMIRNRSRRKRR